MTDLDLSLDLRALIHSESLPPNTIAQAKALLSQIETPVRVMVCGGLGTNRVGLLEALLSLKLPQIDQACLYLHHGDRAGATYHYADGDTVIRDHTNAPPTRDGYAPPCRIDVTLPNRNLRDITFYVPSLSAENALRAGDSSHGLSGLAGAADMVLWCTDQFSGVEESQWRDAPNALKDHSFLVYLASLRPMQRDRLKRLRDFGEAEFHRLETLDLRERSPERAAQLIGDLTRLARLGKSVEEDSAAVFVEKYRDHIAPPAPPQVTQERPEPPAAQDRTPTAGDQALHNLYCKALKIVRDQAAILVDPLPEDVEQDTGRVLQLCAETAEIVAAVFDAHDDPNPAYRFVKEEVLSTADRLLLMSMETGLSPAIDAATTLLQMRRDFDTQINAIGAGSFTGSQSISPIDQHAHA